MMKIQVVVFWVVTKCSDVTGYKRLEGQTASISQQHGISCTTEHLTIAQEILISWLVGWLVG